jgi:hypothetical protein
VTASSKSEVETTGVETYGFASALNWAAMSFAFTHPIRNSTMMSFAGQTFVVERGAVKWLFSLDGAWPFDSRVAAFTLTTELELMGAHVTSVERINNRPRAGRTTYSVNNNGNGNNNNINGSAQAGDGKNLEVKFVVFDHAVADGDLVPVAHAVELVTTPGGTQIAVFHFTFQRFSYAFAYDPEVVMVVHKIGDDGGGLTGGLVAGIVAMVLIVGLVLVGIVRSFVKAAPQEDSAYRGAKLVIVSSDDHHDNAPPVLTRGRRPSYDASSSSVSNSDGGRGKLRRAASAARTSTRFAVEEVGEEAVENFYQDVGDFEMQVLKPKTSMSSSSSSSSSSSKPKTSKSRLNLPTKLKSVRLGTGGKGKTSARKQPPPTEYQWEGEDVVYTL